MSKIETTKQLPTLLREIHDPPQKLYYKGNLDVLSKPCIAFVGTRKSTPYGLSITRQLIQGLSTYDLAIVSGLALGIDTAAHQAALEFDLPTIAILGSGIKQIYPSKNLALAEQITKTGLLLSEYPPDQTPRKHHFPMRNRLISGLSLATIVIEAPKASGSLITARSALDQNREVFVVPGDIDSPNSQGPIHLLQKSSAYPITTAQDIIENTNFPFLHKTKKHNTTTHQLHISPQKQKIIASLNKFRPKNLYQIQKHTKTELHILMSILGELEIDGLVTSHQGSFKLA